MSATPRFWGVTNVKFRSLPFVGSIRLFLTGNLNIELFDRKAMLPRHRDAVGATLRAYPAKVCGMMREGKFQAVEVAGQIDVLSVGVLVDQDAGVKSGHNHVPQNG